MSRWIWPVFALTIAASAFFLNPYREEIVEPPAPVSEGYSKIHIEILNGCGEDGIAQQIGKQLRTFGFDVITVANAPTFNYPETIVIDRVGNPEFARQVAEVLGTTNRIQQVIPDPFRIEEVTIVVGRDYRRLGLMAGRSKQ